MRAWMRAGLPIVAAAMSLGHAPAARADITCGSDPTAATSTSAADFNDKPVAATSTIWFNSVVHPDGIPANQTTTLRITGQSIKLDGLDPVPVPDAVITFSPTATTAVTTFDAGSKTWRTTVPAKDVGNVFAAAVPVTVPGGLPGRTKAVSWTATFVSTAAKSKPHFQWSAAVYSQFAQPGADPGSFADPGHFYVKPVDKDNFSVYPNDFDPADHGDHAGTPEQYKAYVIAGARGGGGTNYTGSLVGGQDITACQAQPPDAPCVWGAPAAGFTDTADFNGTAISAGSTIWLSSVVHPDGIPANQTTTLRLTGQSIKLDGLDPVPVPDAVITFSPKVTTAVTTFDADTDTWRTTVPTKDVGNIFAAGVPVTVPVDLPGNLKGVSWTATSVSPTASVKPHFQWSAAVYTAFGTDWNSLHVKPVDKDGFSAYSDDAGNALSFADNGDHAGTPEQYKLNVTKGARGDGGKNYTGALAGAPDVTACIPQRVIVDTDVFSSVDDVGAMAIAFGLQLNGEATVLAIGVNTRADRPDRLSVAADSWKCAAAIAGFYGSAAPIGAHMPDDGMSLNDPDFIGPCAARGSANPPSPQTAVSVYRRALANAPDHSVVFASTGYFGNLADLLASPPDAISPLNGHDLVALKASMLVSMAGGYAPMSTPTTFGRGHENNLGGDTASAQYVAANWPTKLVWDGYEIGNAVYTANEKKSNWFYGTDATPHPSLYASHPASSPVRAAYAAALTNPDDYYYSYDLVAVYYALRPDDATLDESGPGTNAIGDDGSNVFTLGSGPQCYLTFSDQTGVSPSDGGTAQSESDARVLRDALDGLLDMLPPGVTPGT